MRNHWTSELGVVLGWWIYDRAPVGGAQGEDADLATVLKTMKSLHQPATGTLGVTRDATKLIRFSKKEGWVPRYWLIDVTRGGDHCSPAGDPLVFWRPDSDRSGAVTVRLTDGSWKAHASVEWPAGSDMLAPPQAMPVRDGLTYQVSLDGAKTAFTLHTVPKGVTEKRVLAAWMYRKGCKAQTMAVLREL